MAKSMRSKVKRSFRSKKRESGIYAATEAARLQRLSSKLVATATQGKDVDVPVEDAEGEGDEILGWSWLPILGLLDPNDISVESMECMMKGTRARDGRNRGLEMYLGARGQSLYGCPSSRRILKEKNSC